MISTANNSPRLSLDDVAAQLDGVKWTESGFTALCPGHGDRTNSLSVSEGDDGRVLMNCFAGCSIEEITAAMGITVAQLMPERTNGYHANSNGHHKANGNGSTKKPGEKKPQTPKGESYATADEAIKAVESLIGKPTSRRDEYRDFNGRHVCTACRFDFADGTKTYRPVSLIDGKWYSAGMPTPRPLFNLPALTEHLRYDQQPIGIRIVCEGEKPAQALIDLGYLATASAHGAQSAKGTDWSTLADCDVLIWPDNDPPGEKFTNDVTALLASLPRPPKSIRILPPTGAAGSGHDAANWTDEYDAADEETIKAELSALFKGAKPVEFRQVENGEESSDRTPAYVPNIRTIGDLITAHPHLREPIIDGALRRGEVANVISKSKIGKSWLAYFLAWSIITGRELFGQFPCAVGDVLLVDNELHEELIPYRIRTVAAAMGIRIDEVRERLHVESLRGRNVDLFQLGPLLNESIRGRYKLIILDAMYRLYPDGMDENSNSDVTKFYNQLDRFAAETDTAILCIHHATKGGQSDKDVTDVGAGAGAMSRAADSHLVLRPHQEDDCVVLEAAVRSFPPVDPLVLQWNFPIWTPATHLDPLALKTQKSAKSEDERRQKLDENRRKVHDYLRQPELRETGASKTNIRDHSGVRSGLGQVLDSMVADGNLLACEVIHQGNKSKCKGWKINPEN